MDVACPAPAARVQQQLVRDLGDRLEILWLAGGTARIRSQEWVGVVRVPGLTIQVLPKLAGSELDVLTMLAEVEGLPMADLARLDRDILLGAGGDLVDLVCRMLCRQAAAVLAAGPLQDYRAMAEDLRVLRGRLDFQRQASRHYGRVDVLACRYEEFDFDVLENRLLTAGLDRARHAATQPALRRECQALFEQFHALAPGYMTAPESVRRSLVYDRQNAHYKQAHVWALALLEGHRLHKPFEPLGETTSVFLLNMNQLFEQFVERLVRTCLAQRGVRVVAQPRDATILRHGAKSWGSVRPDLLLRRAQKSLAVDAKYKRYDLKRVAMSDLYQLFLYAQAYGGFGEVPLALLVYPSDDSTPDLRVELRPRMSTEAVVHCLGIRLPTILAGLRGPARADVLAHLGTRLVDAAQLEAS